MATVNLAQRPAREEEPNVIRGWRVLVAEDDADVLGAIADVLERQGATLTLATNGAELVEALGEDGPFDLVITDVSMPWMTGLQAIQSTRYAGLDTPVLVMTALSDPSIPRRVEQLGGCVGFLRKPFDADELERSIAALSGRSP